MVKSILSYSLDVSLVTMTSLLALVYLDPQFISGVVFGVLLMVGLILVNVWRTNIHVFGRKKKDK